MFRELTVQAPIDHTHIIPLFGVSFDFDRPSTPCLVSPYYRNGNITTYLKKHPGVDKVVLVGHKSSQSKESAQKLSQITQVASALSYLHSRSIIHGDLKGVSILTKYLSLSLIKYRAISSSTTTVKHASRISVFRASSKPPASPRRQRREQCATWHPSCIQFATKKMRTPFLG